MNIAMQKMTAEPEKQQNDVILSVDGVSKKFCRDLKKSLFYGVQDIASELMGLREEVHTLRSKEFWAVKNISLELKRGQALGLVGKNGSGKSTLLRIISGLIKPDTGSISIDGRVAPLIALGAGFNPILTGRENIYANMSILGLSKQEIEEQFEEVVAFAEIGEAINSPVQTYSSGMAARLGFACAIHTKPEILLIDEVLAVGDVKFRAKCYRMLNQLQQNGTSFVLVSHNANSILAMCDSAIYINKGELIESGDVNTVMSRYEKELFMIETEKNAGALFLPEKPKEDSLGLDILSLFFRDEQGNLLDSAISGKPANFCIECVVHEKLAGLCIDILIKDQLGEGEWVLRLNNVKDEQPVDLLPGRHEVQLQMPYTGLKPSVYIMKMSIRRDRLYYLDVVESYRFSVIESENMSNCSFYQPRAWSVVSINKE